MLKLPCICFILSLTIYNLQASDDHYHLMQPYTAMQWQAADAALLSLSSTTAPIATPSAIATYINKLFPKKDRSVGGSYMQNPEAFKEMDNAYGEFLITHLKEDQHSWTEFKKHMEEQGIWDSLIRKDFIREQIYIYFYNHLDIPCNIKPLLPVISRSTVKDIVETTFKVKAECKVDDIVNAILDNYHNKQPYAGINRHIRSILGKCKRSAKRPTADRNIGGEERGEPLAKKATINRNSDDSSQQTLSPVPTKNTSLSQLGLNDAIGPASPMLLENHLGSAKRSIYNSPSACLAAKSNTEEEEHGESLAKKAKQQFSLAKDIP